MPAPRGVKPAIPMDKPLAFDRVRLDFSLHQDGSISDLNKVNAKRKPDPFEIPKIQRRHHQHHQG
jgi:hypothetical protein